MSNYRTKNLDGKEDVNQRGGGELHSSRKKEGLKERENLQERERPGAWKSSEETRKMRVGGSSNLVGKETEVGGRKVLTHGRQQTGGVKAPEVSLLPLEQGEGERIRGCKSRSDHRAKTWRNKGAKGNCEGEIRERLREEGIRVVRGE